MTNTITPKWIKQQFGLPKTRDEIEKTRDTISGIVSSPISVSMAFIPFDIGGQIEYFDTDDIIGEISEILGIKLNVLPFDTQNIGKISTKRKMVESISLLSPYEKARLFEILGFNKIAYNRYSRFSKEDSDYLSARYSMVLMLLRETANLNSDGQKIVTEPDIDKAIEIVETIPQEELHYIAGIYYIGMYFFENENYEESKKYLEIVKSYYQAHPIETEIYKGLFLETYLDQCNEQLSNS